MSQSLVSDTQHSGIIYVSEVHITSDSTKMTTYQGGSAVYKLDLKQATSLLSDNSYPIYTIFGRTRVNLDFRKKPRKPT